MAGGAAPNPYGASVSEYAGQYSNTPDYGSPSGAYAAPGLGEDAPYTDTFGWSPSPRISVDSTPDPMRLQQFQVRTVRPEANEPPEQYYGPIDEDDARRHSVETQDADGWEERKGQYKIGPDPRWNPPSETRMTEHMSPASYSFTRPFDQGSKGNGSRTFNGTHFSMADHRRDYEVGGMRAWGAHRNTYRLDPAPWDADMYDAPPVEDTGVYYQGRVQAVDVPESSSRAYRL